MKTNLIDGEWREGAGSQTLDSIDPSTARVTGSIARGTAADIDAAVGAARKAVDAGDWSRLSATERGRLLSRLGELVSRHAEELALVEATDTGKPRSTARADIAALARYFEYFGGAADKLHGDTIPYLSGYAVSTLLEPHGVTGHILPWNYPAQMFGRTLAPALAVGNATVLKPSEDACASILRVAELSREAGFPAGAINVVTGTGFEAGAALAAHPGIDFISFTGSPEVGKRIQQAAAEHHTACTLELGGKSPQIVFADADMDQAVATICRAIVQNGGQTCSAGSRVLVERSAAPRFRERLADAFAKLRAGSPEMDLDCGPIITRRQMQRVQSFIDMAERDKIPVLARGQVADGVSADGFFVAPIAYDDVPRSHALACEEVFGPVLSVMTFEDEADALALANGTEYGLVAAVWTVDGARQTRLSRKLRAGQVFINTYGAGAGIELPFGGTGKSGHGREKGFASLHHFSRIKTVVQRYD